MAQNEWVEELKVKGEQLVDEVGRLVHEGNVRHIVIKHDGKTILEIPVNAGVAVALLAPTIAALGAVGALLTDCTIDVVRTEKP